MSELSNRMIRDMKLAGLVEGTRREYLRAVRQLAAYYLVSPDQLSERKVEDYLLYVRDDLGVAKGTFAPMFAGLKFFYLNTLGYDWPLFTKKKGRRSPVGAPGRRSDGPYYGTHPLQPTQMRHQLAIAYKNGLALVSWCAKTGGIHKIGQIFFWSTTLRGSGFAYLIDKKARRMDPHSTSMETHHACHRRPSDYHRCQPRQQ